MENYKGIDDAVASGVEVKSLSQEESEHLTNELSRKFELNSENEDDENISYFELANQFIRETRLQLVHYQDDFYKYEKGRYIKIPDSDMRAVILRWAHTHKELWGKAKKTFQNEMLIQLQAINILGSSNQIPCFLSSSDSTENLLVFENGILDVNEFVLAKKNPLKPHTSDFFNMAKLSFPFDPYAKPPSIFFEYLNKVQPDLAIQKLLQEWLGYNLVFDTTLERFCFFIGEGANGKSVFMLLMRLIIGKDNISSVDLEGFKPTNRFALANTSGKLANIVGDLNEIDKVGEGVLKQYVSGEETQVERKYKQPFTMKPTARLTYSMNTLPRLVDRSEGIWRRLILIPWNTVVGEKDRNRNFLKESFWIESGELPGILNWALEGLIRLRNEGDFTQSTVVQDSINDFKMDSNPTRVFLNMNVSTQMGGVIPSSSLYFKYRNALIDEGLHPLSAPQFSKEVKRVFKEAMLTPNALIQSDGVRSRNWINLSLSK